MSLYCHFKQTLGLVAAAWLMTEAACCQGVEFANGKLVTSRQAAEADEGKAVEMFESPNLDRFLRRARQFLDEEKYLEAIQVLQSVIEGRTLVANRAAEGEEEEAAATEENTPPGKEGSDSGEGRRLADPSQTVFSEDGRIFRPARRLCHEYLAEMPPVGLTLYRNQYELLARTSLAEALRAGDVSSLEQIGNKYFVTLAAGEAMRVLADRHMHEGRYRAAVQVLRDLSELYPETTLRQLSISQLWCKFKIALCLRLAGEAGAALDAVRALAQEYPDESLRVMGELQPVSALDKSPMFAPEDASLVAEVTGPQRKTLKWLDEETHDLVPLWQHRFEGENPYEKSKSRSQSERLFFVGEGSVVNTAPYASKYGTGTQISFVGPGSPAPWAVFLEHYRLRVASAFTGVLVKEGDGDIRPPKPHDGRPRARVPVYDFALQRPTVDDSRYYVITGYSKTTQGVDALKKNRIVAYDRSSCERVWCSDEFADGEDSYRDVTFLSSPTIFGERLLTPVLLRGAYMLQCSDRATGRPLWRTRLHAGGSEFYKAPGTPVLVSGSTAYITTNAGAVAAVDAFAGDIRWLRKYERSDPLRGTKRLLSKSRVPNMRFSGANQFREQDLRRFLPSTMFARAGTLILAGCDSRMLLCVDGSTGEPVWMIDGTTRFAPYGNLRYLVGMNSENLYAASDSDLVAIDASSGLIQWAHPLPQANDKLTRWRGRGCVLEDFVLMPGDRELLAINADGSGGWRRIQLPSFSLGDDPLRGPNNLFSSGPWLGVAYATGVEVYSTAKALVGLAAGIEDPALKATYLVQAGNLQQGVDVIREWLLSSPDGSEANVERRQQGQVQLVSLARELALQRGSDGIADLDRIEPLLTDRNARQQWFLARIELFQQIQDLAAYQKEQQRLYRYMEGKEG